MFRIRPLSCGRALLYIPTSSSLSRFYSTPPKLSIPNLLGVEGNAAQKTTSTNKSGSAPVQTYKAEAGSKVVDIKSTTGNAEIPQWKDNNIKFKNGETEAGKTETEAETPAAQTGVRKKGRPRKGEIRKPKVQRNKRVEGGENT